MKARHLLLPVLIICLLAGSIAAPALAYDTPLVTDTIWDGWSKTLGTYSCKVTTHIAEGANYVNLSISSPYYPQANAIIPVGQSYYYYNAIQVYVYAISSNSSNAAERTAEITISQPSTSSSSSSTTNTGTALTCVTPGETTLGGDSVTFPLTIQNNNGADKTYTLTANGGSPGWSTTFQYQGRNIYQIYVPSAGQQTVNVVVDTSYDSPIGAQGITISTGDASLTLSVDVTSVNQSADVSAKVSSQIAYIGDKAYYDLLIDNVQSQQNNYKLSVTGLPDNWYYMYLDSRSSTEELSETVVPASTTQDIVLAIVPPNTVSAGDYNFTAVVTTPSGQDIAENLTLKLKAGTGMSVNYDKLAYTASPGQTFKINIYVTNTGTGSALTNVYPQVTAPSGWVVSSSPNSTNTIKSGGTQTFVISVQPPGNIVASDYDVSVKMVSDQASASDDFRITIATSSYIPYIAGGIIVVVLAGIVLLYRKYGRR
ncbi:MAG TPA: NEW3 domain-containing protein [Methanocella sp.]|uniref:COG1470 family protein n=1 Tax=Methanocella sp. TaxID=2052833 RepID=UPI002CB02C77|nr:NEW3 domain-containing protein [Methanocella sp.]HTY91344.1 NEW3 domain-containing protein [Methanocella sp.]